MQNFQRLKSIISLPIYNSNGKIIRETSLPGLSLAIARIPSSIEELGGEAKTLKFQKNVCNGVLHTHNSQVLVEIFYVFFDTRQIVECREK